MPETGAKTNESVERPDGGCGNYLRRVSDLPTIPPVLMRIWQLVDSPTSSPADLEKVISLDQTLTAKVIRVANSAFYHPARRVSNVRDAVVNIGYDAVRSIAIAVSVTALLRKRRGTSSYFPLKDFWRHSIGSGVAARLIATRIPGISIESCFCGGVLHDIGKFVLDYLFPREYSEAVGVATRERMRIAEVEKRFFCGDHTAFGEAFARHWSFSDELTRMIADHHLPPAAMPEGLRREICVVQLADAVTRSVNFGFSGDFQSGTIDTAVVDTLIFGGPPLEAILRDARPEMEAAGEFLNLV